MISRLPRAHTHIYNIDINSTKGHATAHKCATTKCMHRRLARRTRTRKARQKHRAAATAPLPRRARSDLARASAIFGQNGLEIADFPMGFPHCGRPTQDRSSYRSSRKKPTSTTRKAPTTTPSCSSPIYLFSLMDVADNVPMALPNDDAGSKPVYHSLPSCVSTVKMWLDAPRR